MRLHSKAFRKTLKRAKNELWQSEYFHALVYVTAIVWIYLIGLKTLAAIRWIIEKSA